ncbi:hypothetical protein GCM10025867_51410 (plasmid) [Frondihabitans sucicola]|uniref:Uncharacterized protein n=1 Tax=Frondihabitans sucicola TaxID=1268041 RepID=A0ABM8GV46_9MICO|nr:hypothetical protein GCM10025867_45740 [Frondihabitans sucicola]BDZ52900.1 hypothetical protein GCM10025867_51410 [Frondihabitans sucicola]
MSNRLTQAQIGALRTAVDMYEIHLEVDEEDMATLAVLRRAWAKVLLWDRVPRVRARKRPAS